MTRPRQTVTHLPIEQLTTHSGNIRDTLGDLTDMAHSIREHGILQPLTVTEHPGGGYLLIAGHRRLGGALLAGLDRVPVVVRHGVDQDEQLVLMLVENTNRRDLNPVERAEAYGALRNRGLTISDIARRTGTSPSVITYYLSLLDLDDRSLEDVRAGRLKSTEAIAAVREARQNARQQAGLPRRGAPTRGSSGNPWFSTTHPLASEVRRRCHHTDGLGSASSVAVHAGRPPSSTPRHPPRLPLMASMRWTRCSSSAFSTAPGRRRLTPTLPSAHWLLSGGSPRATRALTSRG